MILFEEDELRLAYKPVPKGRETIKNLLPNLSFKIQVSPARTALISAPEFSACWHQIILSDSSISKAT